MRIISGKYKGRRIDLPKNFNARPTTDFAKKGLFDILEHRVEWESINVLDLFSGTGFISFEFASRGVKEILAVEIDFRNAKFIREIAQKYNMPIKVLTANVFKFLNKEQNAVFDIIFCDPPYDMNDIKILPELIFKCNILKEDGLLIIEHDRAIDFSAYQYFLQKRRYGKVNFSFFSKNSEKYFLK